MASKVISSPYTDVPPLYDWANAAWFWSLIAERRREYGSGAVLLGFAASLSEKASVSLQAFDLGLVEKSRSVIREALGDEEYGALVALGATNTWEELPLVHQQRHR